MRALIFLLLLAATASAQTTNLPVVLSVQVPVMPSNIVNVTRTRVRMTNSVIAPVAPGVGLVKQIAGTTTFTLGTFPKDSELCLYIQNPASNKMVWPSGLVLTGGRLPTNQNNVAIVFEEVMGQIWVSPSQ